MGAVGLMQVIPKYHLDKFEELGGPEAVLNPLANIRVGAMILKDTMQRFGGLRVNNGKASR
jgi:soluble lytic murein transglycosylase-like protein